MQDKLRRLQLTQLEMLKDVDCFCQKHNIRYSLYAGTLLGAVRHQGFIPWDDDLDICMSRPEYNRFIKLWLQESPAGYILQNKENSPDFTQSFSKIRKLNTTYRMEIDMGKRYHQGIFIDIFPLDRLPDGSFAQKLFRFRCMLYQLYTREFVPPKGNRLVKLASQIILAATPKRIRPVIRKRLLDKITQFSDDRALPIVAIEIMATLRTLYPADMLDNYTLLPFEDSKFPCFADWDTHLRNKFGNYMQFPPEEERTWKHPPICIDFDVYTPSVK